MESQGLVTEQTRGSEGKGRCQRSKQRGDRAKEVVKVKRTGSWMTGEVMGQNQGHIGKGVVRVKEGSHEVGCGVKGRGHR